MSMSLTKEHRDHKLLYYLSRAARIFILPPKASQVPYKLSLNSSMTKLLRFLTMLNKSQTNVAETNLQFLV